MAGILASGCQRNSGQVAERQADALEDQAERVRAEGKQAADQMKVQAGKLDAQHTGAASPAGKRVDHAADNVREQAEKEAARLDDQADAVRDGAK
jgi:hypothetical protein